MKELRIIAHSCEELESMQDRCAELAKQGSEPLVVHQKLTLPPNGKCMCGSGRKWKKCCAWEAETSVTFYPPGYEHGRQSELSRIMAAAMLAGLEGLTLQ